MLKEVFLWFFTPKRNRYLVLGASLGVLGVLLIPFIIGIPLAGIGFTIFTIGVMVSFAERFTIGKKVVVEFEKTFPRLEDFLKNLIGKVNF